MTLRTDRSSVERTRQQRPLVSFSAPSRPPITSSALPFSGGVFDNVHVQDPCTGFGWLLLEYYADCEIDSNEYGVNSEPPCVIPEFSL